MSDALSHVAPAERRIFDGGPAVSEDVFDRAVWALAGAVGEYLDTADTPAGLAWRTARYPHRDPQLTNPSAAPRQTTPCATTPRRLEGGCSARAAQVAGVVATSPGMAEGAR